MAKRRTKKRSGTSSSPTRSGKRRDWSKIIFYTFSILIVLSMVITSFASLLTYGG